MLPLKYYLSIMLLTCFFAVQAQNPLSGIILDENAEAIAGASVLLKYQDQILSFAITEADGQFVLSVSEYRDSLLIEVNHLSYGRTLVPVISGQKEYTIQLSPQEYDLPEIAVEAPPPVRRNGDTLFFDVESYVQANDENIEQVLQRIPGVEVLASGKITYQGLDISKFYIEGLDLLEGRYRIATRNLGPQHIQEIQILERHQPVKALDSIYRPENAAVNLKLKSNIALTGNARMEAGLPTVGLAEGNIFGFAKKQQFQASASYNNLGAELSQNQVNFYQGVFPLRESQLLNVERVRDPFLLRDSRLYLDNQEWNAGLNFLRKIAEDTEVKVQASGTLDAILRSGNTVVNYFTEQATSRFEKALRSDQNPMEGEGKIILQHNGSRLYTKMDTEVKLAAHPFSANNQINGLQTIEQLDNNRTTINSILDFIINHQNKKAFQFKTEFQYEEKDYQLDLENALLFSPALETQNFFPELRQIAQRRDLFTRAYTNFYFKRKALQGLIEVGPKFSRKSIVSQTLDQFETSDANLIAPEFLNNSTTNRLSLFINQTWKYEKDKFEVQLKAPLSYDFLRLQSPGTSEVSLENLLIYRPRLSLSYQLDQVNEIGMGLFYFRDFQTYGDLFYEGLIVTSNRSISTQINQPNAYRGFRTNLGLSGLNPFNNHFYGISLAYRRQTNELLSSTVFNEEGISSGISSRENTFGQFSANALYKFYLWRRLNIELKANYSLSEQDQLVNQVFSTLLSHRLGSDQQLSISYGSQATTLESRYSRFWIPQIDQYNDQWQFRLEHFWQITTPLSTKVEWQNIYFAGNGERAWTPLLNWQVQYQWKARKVKCSLTLYNLLNEAFFTRFSQNLYSNFTANYRLNPRRLVLAVKKQF